MITAINSATSFKAIYQRGRKPLTDAQEKTLQQIKAVIDEKAPFDNFIFEPLKADKLDLGKVAELQKEDTINGKETFSFTQKNLIHIGTYSENKPFTIEDVTKAEKEHNDLSRRLPMIIVGSVFGAIMIGLLTLSSIQKPKNVEKVVDTIATKVDTLKSAEILKP